MYEILESVDTLRVINGSVLSYWNLKLSSSLNENQQQRPAAPRLCRMSQLGFSLYYSACMLDTSAMFHQEWGDTLIQAHQ